jgi:ribonuclease J
MDHCGNIGFLHERIPIVASPTTIAILKAMRDSGRPGIGSEIVYHSPRERAEDDRVLKAKRVYVGRDFICTEGINEELRSFICYRPGQEAKNVKKLEAGEICCVGDKGLPFEIKAFDVDHSIYGATSFILYGDITVAYTGDIRLHGKRKDKTKEFVKNAKDASVLIIEGTRAGREKDINVSEDEVFQNCLKVVEESEGLVIADFSPRNFERLETFKEIAEKTSKQLVVTARDAYMLHAIELVDGVSRMKNVEIYNELRESRDKWESLVVREKWGGNYVDPIEIRRNPENYILCFSFYDVKHLLDIKPENGSYIYSSSEAFTEEQEFDFQRLYTWLETFNFDVYGFRMVLEEGKLVPEFVKGYHASGHATKEDLKWIIEQVNPEHIIPVHTENSNWFEENFEGVKFLKNYERYSLD